MDEDEKKKKKKRPGASRADSDASQGSDPDFAPSERRAGESGRRHSGYATRRTRQVEPDPPEHDLSRVLPLDPPDCSGRRGKKRKARSSPQLRCAEAAAAAAGGGTVGGSGTGSEAPGRGQAAAEEPAAEDAEGFRLAMLGPDSRLTSTVASPIVELFHVRLGAGGRVALNLRQEGGSTDVSRMSSAVSTPEGTPAAVWTDPETDSQPPRLGSPTVEAPAPAARSPAFGPPLLRPVLEQLSAAAVAASTGAAPTSKSRTRRKPERRSQSASVARRAPSASPRKARPPSSSPRKARAPSNPRDARPPSTSQQEVTSHSAFASLANGSQEAIPRPQEDPRVQQDLASEAAVGLGLLCQAAEAAEAMAAAEASRSELLRFMTTSEEHVLPQSEEQALVQPGEQVLAQPEEEVGVATASAAGTVTPEPTERRAEGESPGPSGSPGLQGTPPGLQGTPLKLYRMRRMTPDGKYCWSTTSPQKERGHASRSEASTSGFDHPSRSSSSTAGSNGRSRSQDMPTPPPASTSARRRTERTPEKPRNRRNPSRSPRGNVPVSRSRSRSSSAGRSRGEPRHSKSPRQRREGPVVGPASVHQEEDSRQEAWALRETAPHDERLEAPREQLSSRHQDAEGLREPSVNLHQEDIVTHHQAADHQSTETLHQAIEGRQHRVIEDHPEGTERVHLHEAEISHYTEEVHSSGSDVLHQIAEASHQSRATLVDDNDTLHSGFEVQVTVPAVISQDIERLHQEFERFEQESEWSRAGFQSHHETAEGSGQWHQEMDSNHASNPQSNQDLQQSHGIETAILNADSADSENGVRHSDEMSFQRMQEETESSYQWSEAAYDGSNAPRQDLEVPYQQYEGSYQGGEGHHWAEESAHSTAEQHHQIAEDPAVFEAEEPPQDSDGPRHGSGAPPTTGSPQPRPVAEVEGDVTEEARTGRHWKKRRASKVIDDSSSRESTQQPGSELRPEMEPPTTPVKAGGAGGDGGGDVCSRCGLTFHTAQERIVHKRSGVCLRVGQ